MQAPSRPQSTSLMASALARVNQQQDSLVGRGSRCAPCGSVSLSTSAEDVVDTVVFNELCPRRTAQPDKQKA
jgi:hypothetical protein